MIEAPKGFGVYLRDLTKDFRDRWPAAKLAKHLKDHHVKHVYILAFWDEGGSVFRRYNRNVGKPYVEAFIKEGITVGIWGFPHPDFVQRYVEMMADTTYNFAPKGGITHWLHDPELPWKAKGNPRATDMGLRGQGEAIKGFGSNKNKEQLSELAIELCQAEAVERAMLKVPGVGITSYGMAKWHPIPYDVFAGYGWSSPQLYSVNRSNVDLGLSMWADRGSHVFIPSVPVFGPNSDVRLSTHLNAFLDEGTPVDVTGFVVWSFPQMSPMEARTIRSFAEKVGWA